MTQVLPLPQFITLSSMRSNMAEHPITPPPDLVNQWYLAWDDNATFKQCLIEAARWGADQELEACCEQLKMLTQTVEELRAARRPKPPSLKEQALEAWEECWGSGFFVQKDSFADTIRRALEALDD